MTETPEQPLLVLGTGNFALEAADLVSEIPGYRLEAFVDSVDRERCQETLNGLPILWVDDVAPMADTHRAVCALGTTRRNRFIERVDALGLPFATLRHPSAHVSRTSSVGEGSLISVGVVVAAHTRLGRHVLVNRGALIGHHTVIGDYVTIGPGANVAGSCQVGEGTHIGMSAIVLDHVTIGSHSVVGAGAVVTKDVPDRVKVVGIPARIVKEAISGI